jgi:hypothetical protein
MSSAGGFERSHQLSEPTTFSHPLALERSLSPISRLAAGNAITAIATI